MFDRIFAELAADSDSSDRLMIDATHFKAHRTAASLLKRGSTPMYRTQLRRADHETPCRLR